MPARPVRLAPALLVALMAGALGVRVSAQELDGRFSRRLAEILEARGHLEPAEREAVTEAAAERGRRRALDAEIDRLVESPVRTRHRVGRGWVFHALAPGLRIALGGRLKVRFTVSDADEDEGDKPDFDVRRLRLWVRGRTDDGWWRFRIQANVSGDRVRRLGDASASARFVELQDAYADWGPDPSLRIRFGQFRAPTSRQRQTGAKAWQFGERAINSRVFGRGREPGLMVHGYVGEEDAFGFEYRLGAFDGEGDNRTNDDRGLLWAARFAVHPFGEVGYVESDVEGTESPRLSLGVYGNLHQDDGHARRGDVLTAGVDFALLWRGLFVSAELGWEEDRPAGRVIARGWMVQAGWFVIPGTLEIGARAANVDYRGGGLHRTDREYLGVIGWFFAGHALKTQIDFGFVDEEQREQWRLRLQTQVTF